jgi:hypothetical protein
MGLAQNHGSRRWARVSCKSLVRDKGSTKLESRTPARTKLVPHRLGDRPSRSRVVATQALVTFYFELPVSSFFRHSCFDIRHFCLRRPRIAHRQLESSHGLLKSPAFRTPNRSGRQMPKRRKYAGSQACVNSTVAPRRTPSPARGDASHVLDFAARRPALRNPRDEGSHP